MAGVFFQNNTCDINSIWYESHKLLIKRIVAELNVSDREDELIDKFIGKPIKIKKQRDELYPKRPKTSFLFFCDEHRDIVKKNKPNLKLGDTMKELGILWKECCDKSKYSELSDNAKIEYEDNLETYKINNYYDN